MLHKNSSVGNRHAIHNWEFADSAARLAATPDALDVGKCCKQSDTGVFYILASHSPLLWIQLGQYAENFILPISAKAAHFTLALADLSTYIRVSGGSSITVTVPANADVPFPVGSNIQLIQSSSGAIIFSPAGGVTINSAYGLKTKSGFSAVSLVKVDTDVWDLIGDTEPV